MQSLNIRTIQMLTEEHNCPTTFVQYVCNDREAIFFKKERVGSLYFRIYGYLQYVLLLIKAVIYEINKQSSHFIFALVLI